MSNAKTAPFLDQLREYAERYPDEDAVATQFFDFVSEHDDCFERSLQVGHITGSAWVINAAGTHALFTHHRKLDRWLQLGGHCDGDHDVARVALREAEEESGLAGVELVNTSIFDLDAHPIPARGDEPEHIHYDVRYFIQDKSNAALQISEESNDLAWISHEEVLDRFTSPSIQRMARKWAAWKKLA